MPLWVQQDYVGYDTHNTSFLDTMNSATELLTTPSHLKILFLVSVLLWLFIGFNPVMTKRVFVLAVQNVNKGVPPVLP